MFVNGEAALTDYYKQIIEGELNVKDVIFKEDVSDLTDYTFKPQMRILGPKYGKDLGKIRNILANLTEVRLKIRRKWIFDNRVKR